MILFWAFAAILLVVLVGAGIWVFGMAILEPVSDRYWEESE